MKVSLIGLSNCNVIAHGSLNLEVAELWDTTRFSSELTQVMVRSQGHRCPLKCWVSQLVKHA